MLFLALACMGWFGWVAVGRGFVAVIWCVWFWVLAVLRWEVLGIGAVVCDCVGASHWSCYWGRTSDGGMSAEVTVLSLIIGGIQVKSVVDSGHRACVREDLKGKTVSTNLTCLEIKIFNVDGS